MKYVDIFSIVFFTNRCLLSNLEFKPAMVCKIVMAYCVLHNTARQVNLPDNVPEYEEEEEDVNNIDVHDTANGRNMRSTLSHSALQSVVYINASLSILNKKKIEG